MDAASADEENTAEQALIKAFLEEAAGNNVESANAMQHVSRLASTSAIWHFLRLFGLRHLNN